MRKRNQSWVATARLGLAGLLVFSACSRNNSTDQGTQSAVQSGTGAATETDTPTAAPQAQPRFGQVGNATGSRITTNSAGRPTEAMAGRLDATNPDEALSQRVKVALSTGTTGTTGVYSPDMLLDIQVTATNGVITLRGTVGSESAKQAFGQRARALDGVHGVNNELVVSPTAATAGPRPGVPSGRGQVDAVPQRSDRDVRR